MQGTVESHERTDSAHQDHGAAGTPFEKIDQALHQILSSAPFRNSLQCQSLLSYIVKHTLADEGALLRERVIGCEVFARPADYETGEDPVVRIRAAEVRKRLAQYYQSLAEPPEVRIEVPSGSYRAVFHWRTETEAHGQHEPAPHAEASHDQPPGPLPATVVESGRPAGAPRFFRWGILAALLLAILGGATWFLIARSSPQAAAWRDFWSPWTSSSKPVLISVGSNAVYRFNDELMDHYVQEHHLGPQGIEFFLPFSQGQSIPASQIYPAADSFVALGDVAAVSSLVAVLAHKQQNFQERFPNDVSFAELNSNPSILVGGFNNPMTIEITKNLRFVPRQRNRIDDTQDPNRHWILNASSDSHDTEDYAIVTWMPHRYNDAPMMSLAGLGQYGTLAASQFVSNPAAIAALARTLPKGWQDHNLQILLHVKVVDFKPSGVDVAAIAVI